MISLEFYPITSPNILAPAVILNLMVASHYIGITYTDYSTPQIELESNLTYQISIHLNGNNAFSKKILQKKKTGLIYISLAFI